MTSLMSVQRTFVAAGLMGLIAADMLLTLAVLAEIGVTRPAASQQGLAAANVTMVSALLLMIAFLLPVVTVGWQHARQRLDWGETA